MQPTKACPIVARLRDDEIDVLMFRHPLAGTQLVKGTIEAGESAAKTAVRELAEESGIRHSEAIHPLGLWTNAVDGLVWSFHLIAYHGIVPETWDHWTLDDGGMVFSFFWHPLALDPADACHPTFMGALDHLRTVLTPSIVRMSLDIGTRETALQRHMPCTEPTPCRTAKSDMALGSRSRQP